MPYPQAPLSTVEATAVAKTNTFTSVSDTSTMICTKSTKITPQIKPQTVYYHFIALNTDAIIYIRVE